jgi:hypothetical protein
MITLVSPFLVIYKIPPPPESRSVIDGPFGSGNMIYIPPTPIQRDGTIIYRSTNDAQVPA